MRPRVLLIALFVALGFALSTLIAFICAATFPMISDPEEGFAYWRQEPTNPFVEVRSALVENHADLRMPLASSIRGFGTLCTTFAFEEPTDPRFTSVQQVRHGWPLYAFKGEQHIGNYVLHPGLHSAFLLHPGTRLERVVGFRPIPFGLAVDTAFFALASWFVVAGARQLRCILRRRAHQCPHCGYPAGSTPDCSECGASRPARARVA